MFPPRGPSSDFEYPRGPLKRYHDDGTPAQNTNDESLMGGDASYSSEHRSKRLHALPFRTSPTALRWNPATTMATGMPQPPSSMTPPGSFSETATSFQTQGSSDFGEPSRAAIAMDNVAMADMDMDMSLDCEPSQADLMPPSQPGNGFSDRMPTPMQPTFAAQVRGGNWNGANANAGYAGSPSMPSFMQKSDAMAETSASYASQGNERSVPRPLEHPAVMGDWGMIQNRSLPSPISEDGGGSGSDNHHTHEYYDDHDHDHIHDHDHDSVFSTPRRSGAIASSPLHAPLVGAASSPVRATTDGRDSAATPSPKKGHSRSRHTIIAWTNQPGMKKSFSIGYRADCEKCRNRVPGHFNHIVVS